MKLGKMKPTATVVAQFAAGVEVEAIKHNGILYLPVVGLPDFEDDDEDERPLKGAAEKAAAPATKKSEPKPEKAESTTKYTEKELMDMDAAKELMPILEGFGVNPDDFDGKNTNKKLRLLILQAQAGEIGDGGADAEEEEEEEEETPKKKAPAKGKAAPKKPAKDEDEDEDAEKGSIAEQVGDLLEDFDAGKKNRKKTIAAFIELGTDVDSDKINAIMDEFEENADLEIDDVAKKLAAVIEGSDEEEEEEKPKSRRGGKKAPAKKKADEKLVEPEDLEVGDRVSVYWADDNEEWFPGKVKSIKKGKIMIAYDDETEELLDAEIHTKIKLLED